MIVDKFTRASYTHTHTHAHTHVRARTNHIHTYTHIPDTYRLILGKGRATFTNFFSTQRSRNSPAWPWLLGNPRSFLRLDGTS